MLICGKETIFLLPGRPGTSQAVDHRPHDQHKSLYTNAVDASVTASKSSSPRSSVSPSVSQFSFAAKNEKSGRYVEAKKNKKSMAVVYTSPVEKDVKNVFRLVCSTRMAAAKSDMKITRL